jgi:ribonuclease P protein component
MDKGEQGFPKAARIRAKPEIDRVFHDGTRYSCRGMRLHAVTNELDSSRVVIVPVRSFAGSVQRNRAKRLAREAWRLGAGKVRMGFDVALVLFPGADTLAEYRSSLSYLLRKSGLSA